MWAWIFKSPALAAAGVLGLVCSLLLIQTRVQAGKVDRAEARYARAQAQFDQVVEANKSLSASMDSMKRVNDDLIEMVRADTERMQAVARQVERERSDIRVQAERVRSARQEIKNETPSCADLARVDIVAVCPSLAISLRDQARNQKF